jgi:PLP dependent protein
MTNMETIATRIERVQDRIVAAARRAGRAPEEVRLVAVTKTHPPELIAEVIAAGVRDLGENRVQEAEPKIAALAARGPSVTWHLIGHLQTNKAARAAALFDVVQSIDSLKLAAALDRHVLGATMGQADNETGRQGQAGVDESLTPSPLHPFTRSSLPILLQVNVSGEATKEGFALAGWEARPEVSDAFVTQVEQILALPHLSICGLMTIAPWGDDPQQARATFRATRRLRDELARRFPAAAWPELSMGMTDDFEVAIEEGATVVRVGRAIFGERQ